MHYPAVRQFLVIHQKELEAKLAAATELSQRIAEYNIPVDTDTQLILLFKVFGPLHVKVIYTLMGCTNLSCRKYISSVISRTRAIKRINRGVYSL